MGLARGEFIEAIVRLQLLEDQFDLPASRVGLSNALGIERIGVDVGEVEPILGALGEANRDQAAHDGERYVGYPPTQRQTADAIGLASPNAARGLIHSLAIRGLLEIQHGGPRGIRIVREGEVPLVQLDGDVQPDEPLLAERHIVERVCATLAGLFTPAPDLFVTTATDAFARLGAKPGDLAAIRQTHRARSGEIIAARVDAKPVCARYRRISSRYADLCPVPGATSSKALRIDLDKTDLHIDGTVLGTLNATPFPVPDGNLNAKPSPEPLSPGQRAAFVAVRDQIRKTGVAPPQKLLVETLGVGSREAANQHIRLLVSKAWLERPSGSQRAIRLLQEGDVPLMRPDEDMDPREPLDAPHHIIDRVAATLADCFSPHPDYFLAVPSRRIADGDPVATLVAVQASQQAENGTTVVARTDNAITVGRYRRINEQTVELAPVDAPAASGPLRVDLESRNFRIDGIVLGTVTTRPFPTTAQAD